MTSNSWVLKSLDTEQLSGAQLAASRNMLMRAFNKIKDDSHNFDLAFTAEALELAILDMLDNEEMLDELRENSEKAFQLFKMLPIPEKPVDAGFWLLKIACIGILGDRGADVSRLLRENSWVKLPVESEEWGTRALACTIQSWICLFRKNGWNDLDEVENLITTLRVSQKEYEKSYLNDTLSGGTSRTAAWELMAIYHLAKAAEVLCLYQIHGKLNDNTYDIRQQLEAQFDRAFVACLRAELIELDTLARLLYSASLQAVNNSIWTVTRAVNSRVTRFVEQLVARERENPILEMLPPQRKTLREEGLLGSSYRSVVVNLPTSSGKTFIAQFRILQALNQFDYEKGWVAYLAPTRALVNQINSRLRKDFEPLDIVVEKVSPALEVDGVEASLLTEKESSKIFRILVTTPEKLNLMIRNGWEERIGRPLTLVVVDEAHNISQTQRGITLELLLSTINRECRNSQFLLLTPFIENAATVAKWLSPDSNKHIGIGLRWKPNDTAIFLSKPKQFLDNTHGITLKTIYTNKETIHIPEEIDVYSSDTLNLGNNVLTKSKLAAVTANYLKKRGPVIVLAQRPSWVWSLAKCFKCKCNYVNNPHEDIQVVQEFLSNEFGKDYELIELLNYGVGVHHSGLSDETKLLMEWLLENERISILVATTTIAQGVNFPVTGVVFAHYKYPDGRSTINMPPEDFWNIVGRAGRVNQESLGMVAFASNDEESEKDIKEFVSRNVTQLNSTLISMIDDAIKLGYINDLEKLYWIPEWSSFLQYLVHSYKQINNQEKFLMQIEQVLRGTLGFQTLRSKDPYKANMFVSSVQKYIYKLSGKPLDLVDSTGFSLESVMQTLGRLSEEKLTSDIWNANTLFDTNNDDLSKIVGILLKIPELRKNYEGFIDGRSEQGDKIARIIIDWVNGQPIYKIAEHYAGKDMKKDMTKILTECCQSIFGKLSQATSWGVSAIQSMTVGNIVDDLTENEKLVLRNIPARIYYGVNSDKAVALRLLGVPRTAALPLANLLEYQEDTPILEIRKQLKNAKVDVWRQALGAEGDSYYKIWRILEGD